MYKLLDNRFRMTLITLSIFMPIIIILLLFQLGVLYAPEDKNHFVYYVVYFLLISLIISILVSTFHVVNTDGTKIYVSKILSKKSFDIEKMHMYPAKTVYWRWHSIILKENGKKIKVTPGFKWDIRHEATLIKNGHSSYNGFKRLRLKSKASYVKKYK